MTDYAAQVTFINVGNGDAILVEVPDGNCREGRFVMLIDGGSNENAEYEETTTGRIRAAEYLEQKGIGHIDIMVCTHIHEDHTCGLLPAAKKWMPKELWQPFPMETVSMMKYLWMKAETESGNKFIAALNDFHELTTYVKENGGKVLQKTPFMGKGERADESMARGIAMAGKPLIAEGVSVEVLGPSAAALERENEWMKELYGAGRTELLPEMDRYMNSASLLLRFTCGGKIFLFTGDTEKDCYKDCMEKIRADVFKVGHHGQENSLSREVLQAVSPEAAVICVSSDRRYESGSPVVLQMLAEAGVRTYYSDCPVVPPYTDGVTAHRAVVFQVGKDGTLQAAYENNR